MQESAADVGGVIDRIQRVVTGRDHWVPRRGFLRRYISFVHFHLYVLRRLTQSKTRYCLGLLGTVFEMLHKAIAAKELTLSATAFVAIFAGMLWFPLSAGLALFLFVLGATIWFVRWTERRAASSDLPPDSPIDLIGNASREFADCVPNDEDSAIGFEKVALGGGDVVFRSPRLDRHIRETGFTVEERANGLSDVLRSIKMRRDTENALRLKRANAMCNKQDFRNEPKLCLLSDLDLTTTQISVGMGDYFTGWLTNDFCNIRFSQSGQTIEEGTDLFPVSDDRKLKSISKSGLQNIIGVGTIGHTSDNILYIWYQSSLANQSGHRPAPSGSGSADPRDFYLAKKLRCNPIEVAMMRELLEEGRVIEKFKSTSWAVKGDARPIADTKVIGFFRWVNQGGKPEFMGVTKLNVARHEVRPDNREVELRSGAGLERKAQTVTEMLAGVEHFLRLPDLSVPLAINLRCLREALLEDPERWARFFRIKQDLPVSKTAV